MIKHPLIKYSTQYMIEAKVLLENNVALKQKGETLLQLIELGVKDIG